MFDGILNFVDSLVKSNPLLTSQVLLALSLLLLLLALFIKETRVESNGLAIPCIALATCSLLSMYKLEGLFMTLSVGVLVGALLAAILAYQSNKDFTPANHRALIMYTTLVFLVALVMMWVLVIPYINTVLLVYTGFIIVTVLRSNFTVEHALAMSLVMFNVVGLII